MKAQRAEAFIADNDYVGLWANDLKSVKEGEEIRIVCGEASWQLMNSLKEFFKQAKEKPGVNINTVAGPIISVDEKTGSNPVFELIDKNTLQLWISPFRQQSHYRIFGRRFLYKENYHVALSPERHGEYIYDSFVISKYIYDFDNLIASLYMKPYKSDKLAVKKTDREILEMEKRLGKNYDFLVSTRVVGAA